MDNNDKFQNKTNMHIYVSYVQTRGPSGPKALTWEQKELDYSEKMQADSWRLDQKSDF